MIPIHQHQLKQWYKFPNLTLILLTMFHWALCKFPKLIKNGSQFWRPGSIINASICKNGGPRTVAFIVENQIREIRCAFFETNILMGIHKLPKMRDYWSVDEGLGNTLIQKTMTRDRFLEILQNLHFVDNLQKLPKQSLALVNQLFSPFARI